MLYNDHYLPELGFKGLPWRKIGDKDFDALVVARDKFGPIGFLGVLDNEELGSEYLASSAVHPDFRERGTWDKMMAKAEEYAREKKAGYLDAVPAGPVSTKLETALGKKGFHLEGHIYKKKVA